MLARDPHPPPAWQKSGQHVPLEDRPRSALKQGAPAAGEHESLELTAAALTSNSEAIFSYN